MLQSLCEVEIYDNISYDLMFGDFVILLRINDNRLFQFSIRKNVACSIGPVPDLFIAEQ